MTEVQTMRNALEHCANVMQSLASGASDGGERLRVGIPFRSIPGWGAGIGFYRMFVRSLALVAEQQGLEIGAVIDRSDDKALAALAGLPGGRWSVIKPDGKKTSWAETAAFHGIRVFIDLFESQPWAEGTGTIAWIPDFQHVHLPESFTAEDIRYRNESFADRAGKATHILCSSESVASDFRSVLPELAGKAVVARFPSNLVFEEMPHEAPHDTVQRYHLPAKFVLVANQFWSHKNHPVVLQAVAAARARGVDVPVVLTGLPLDYRDPTNSPTSQILQMISRLGIHDLVRPLGQVPYRDLIQLMRAATLIVQPSKFEGWSTIVQDAKALGRPVFCSAIAVHREQSPDPSALFGCDQPEELAALLCQRWPSLGSHWDAAHEAASLGKHLEVAMDYGKIVAALARQSLAAAHPH